MKKERLDVVLLNRGLAESRSKAQAIIMEGLVFIGGQRVRKGQPEGAFRGLGISPLSTTRWLALATLGSGTGTADIRLLE